MFTIKRGRKTDPNRAPLNEKDHKALVARLKERKKKLQEFPLFKIIPSGYSASLSTPKDSRVPLSVKDIQCLLLCGIVGELNFRLLHKWFSLYKWKNIPQTIVLVVENLSVNDLEENQDLFPHCIDIFDDGVEMVNEEGLSLSAGLAYCPVTLELRSKLNKVYMSLQEAFNDGHIFSMTDLNELDCRKEEQMKRPLEKTEDQKSKKGCSKLDLLLSPFQLIIERFPLPYGVDPERHVFTKDKYEPVTENSPMFSIDCEWCLCVDGSIGLARVAIVDENLDPVYHTYVSPDKPVRDYSTKWSGITPEKLKGISKKLKDVQEDIRKLLPPDAILVGHGLCSDMYALQMFHPYIIDSSLIYNLSGARSLIVKLQFLASVFCNREIQLETFHDPNEDAAATMELILLKLKMGLEYGDVRYSPCDTWEGVTKEKLLKNIANSIFGLGIKRRRVEEDSADLDFHGFLYMKLFKFLEAQRKRAALITQPMFKDNYLAKATSRPGLFINPSKPAEVRIENNVLDVIAALPSQIDKDFVLLHSEIGEEKEGKQHLKELDKAIAGIYDQMAQNAMLIVIFGGKTNVAENGLCMVRVKKPRKEELE